MVRVGTNTTRDKVADENSFATTLVTILIDQLGVEALEWHPMSRRMELEDIFGVRMPVINGDKINAAADILLSDSFFKRVPVFVQYCNVLSNSHFSFGIFDPADAEECAWGITEGLLLASPEEEEPFSEEIRYYIGKVLDDEGIKTPPDVLQIGLSDKGADFSELDVDDPAVFQAEFKFQQDESDALKSWLRDRLRALVTELENLELENGSTTGLLSKLRA